MYFCFRWNRLLASPYPSLSSARRSICTAPCHVFIATFSPVGVLGYGIWLRLLHAWFGFVSLFCLGAVCGSLGACSRALAKMHVGDWLKKNTEKTKSPSVDYTSAEYITLLFTDLGVLTPSAVSDELIRLYGEA